MIGERYEQRTRLAVLKVRVGQKFRVELLRHEALGHIVHWLGKCSVLCPGSDCPACLAATGARWVGVMPCRVLGYDGSKRVMLVEFSGDAWARLAGLLRAEGREDACGCVVELTRGRSRGGLVADPVEFGEEAVTKGMPDSVLLDALATLYGLPRCMPSWDGERWTEEVRGHAVARVVRALEMVPQQ
jgi:hypothetical protein